MRLSALILFATVLLAGLAFAQDSVPAPTPSVQAAASQDAPVSVPEPSELAMQYYHSGNYLWLFLQVWGIALPALFLFTGFSARMQAWATRIGRKWFFIICAYFLLFALINFLIEIPIAFYSEFIRQHAYGLSNQTFAKWAMDSLIEFGFTLVIGCILLWVPYLLFRKSPTRWWLYCGLLLIPLLILTILLRPLVFEPMFNTFGPMKDKALEGKILALADRAGIENSRVFEVDKSVDTKAVNAYVTGFGNTKRIVLWDTIIDKLDEDELLFVMGHEMGHYVLNHIIKSIFVYSGIGIIGLFLVHRLAGWMLRRFHHQLGFSHIYDIASIPLLLLCVNIISLALTPMALAYSRHNEFEADRFGIEITQTSHAAATAFVKLQQENLGNPRPGAFTRWWRGTHPSIGARIDFFNSYFPWKSGDPLRYGHYFKATQPPDKTTQ